nr:hypothetical protein [Nonlabens ulvanivorans]
MFEIYGYYRTDLKIVSDWEFFINTICVNHVSYLKINLIISNFYKGGISNNSESVLSHREERKQVLIEYFDYYDMSYDDFILENENSIRLLKVVNPEIKVVITNKILRKILNFIIGAFSFIIKTKRSIN